MQGDTAAGRPLKWCLGGTGRPSPTRGIGRQRRESHLRAPTGETCTIRAVNGIVLVLNQNYEPLNVCNLPRAFRLLFGEKAEDIEYDHQMVRTPRTEFRAPSVIRLQH